MNKAIIEGSITIEAIQATTKVLGKEGCIGCCFNNYITAECNEPHNFAKDHDLPACRRGYIYIITGLEEMEL
jgi:hypothetical protein